MMEFSEAPGYWLGGSLNYAEGSIVDASILEVVNEDGEQVLGEHDRGGFIGNAARAFFVPEEDGTYYLAVGAGRQDPGGTGSYTLSLRVDDHADDYELISDVALLPGQGITARIDSDVAPRHPGLNPWDWASHNGKGVPVFGVESLDDRDVFRVEVSEERKYVLAVRDAPLTVGIWGIWDMGRFCTVIRKTGPSGRYSSHTLPVRTTWTWGLLMRAKVPSGHILSL